jgi:hypothetical protein
MMEFFIERLVLDRTPNSGGSHAPISGPNADPG